MTSLWETTVATRVERAPLDADTEVDVAIVGAGYSGLWTAYYLLDHDPSLRVAIVEREHVGFGASGRNGGWCIGEMAANHTKLAAAGSSEQAIGQMRAMFDTVGEVGRVVDRHGIECDYHRGGTVRVARNDAQVAGQRAEVSHLHGLGFDESDVRLLAPQEASAMFAASEVRGGVFQAHSAVLHPLKLVRGLADSVALQGVSIYEETAATSIAPGVIDTHHGRVHAQTVVLATEAYTRDLPGHRRNLVPLYSLMIATEPLPDDTWAQIGLADRQTFADDRHLVIYGQRTADDRLAFGGRGAPYRFGSRTDAKVEHSSRTHDRIEQTLRELVPQIGDARVTHRWGGVLAVPRDWFPSVTFDRVTRIGTLGGYVGEGVAASNLAGRTLADLIVGADTERSRYPWVDRRSRKWEPEPFRWLAINASLRAMQIADRLEDRTGRPSRLAAVMNRLVKGRTP